MDKLRLALIHWNIAPLSVVAFLCWINYLLVKRLIAMECTSDTAIYVALSGLVATMGGITYKLYESMQRNRKDDSGN